jgi:predicted helicase
MSIQAIHQYHNAIHKIYQFSGQSHEQAIKDEFKKLLNHYCEKRNLLVVSEINIKSKNGNTIRPDGIVKNILNLDCGYWESKANVDLEKEIDLKINAGYPLNNTLFQDNKTAVLYQDNKLLLKVSIEDVHELDKLLTQFVSYESKEVTEFNEAINAFKKDLPTILTALRDMIVLQENSNPSFIQSRQDFLTICQASINPDIKVIDINEMLLQHILTEEIFISIFSDAQFFRDNNIAKELYKVESTFFSGTTKRNTLSGIQHYYALIKSRAANIPDHHDKQRFLKVIYENFYKAYNPKAADKLGIVYTPHEIVKFQIESVEYLLGKHFSKSLNSKDIKILDPCTGTGTYICELIEYLSPLHLKDKYRDDIFANELGLLPYYIANLNIEYTYQQKMKEYVDFNHICWVDTLDNTGFELKGTNTDLFGITLENTARIKEQNSHKISVIIGNPPYNANQQNENDNNKNRSYNEIDSRIKNSYVKNSVASNKANLYDMYTRFYRWAFDRLNQEQGIIAFVTNNSFINKRAFDGFRQCISEEFDFAYIIDTRSDVRDNPKIAGTTHNVFGIQTGVAIMFLVKENKNTNKDCKIFYTHLADEILKGEKLSWLENNPLEKIEFDKIIPDKNNNWINQTDNGFEKILSLIDKNVKDGKSNQAIFKLYSLGVNTNRDEWVYDFEEANLKNKMKFFILEYNRLISNKNDTFPNIIKWSSSLKLHFENKIKGKFKKEHIKNTMFRPFVKKYHYTEKIFNHRLTQNHYDIFGKELNNSNNLICFSGQASSKPFQSLVVNNLSGLDFLEKTQCLPLHVYDTEGEQHDNITNWALSEFKSHYQIELTKLDIFHYVYAVLHNPAYREKYELNLKRDFPRIPFYENFSQWSEYGKQLMDLHLNYETAEPFPLKRQDLKISKIPKVKLKADKENGLIFIDDNTTLSEIPLQAWEYKLGNRSALEWILDQYKEKKPKDATIAELFNTYRFADYKEQVIDLLMRVCTVSVMTINIVKTMKNNSLNEL